MLLICLAFTPPRSFQLNRLLKMAVTARQPSSIHCLRPPLLHRIVAYWTLRVTVAAWLVEPAEAVMVTVLVPPGALFPELEPPQPSI